MAIKISGSNPVFYVCAALFLLLLAANVSAREWYIQPSFNVKGEFDDNKRLLAQRFDAAVDKSAYGVLTSARAKMGVRSDIYDVAFDARVDINRYFADLNLDSDDVFLDLESSVNVTERNKFGFNGHYTRDSTLTSELEVTGLVQENVPREEWSVGPDWTYNLDESKFLQANYSHTEVSYEQAVLNQFFDYTTDSTSISFVHQWNPALQNYISFSALLFEVPDLRRDTREFTVNVGSEYQLSETWSASLSVGGRFTHTKLIVAQPVLPLRVVNGVFVTEDITLLDDAQGLIFAFGTKKQFEKGAASFDFSRSTTPQGNGRLQSFDKFSFSFNHKLTRHLQFLLDAGINVTSSTASVNLSNDRTYYYAKPILRWNFNRQASISGGYQFRRQEFERNKQIAVSNAVFFTFNYAWDKLTTQKF